MQIKVHSAVFKKGMTTKAKKYVDKVLVEINADAAILVSQMKKRLPVVDGNLKNSYGTSLNKQKKSIKVGSHPSDEFIEVRYAQWIETGRRRGKGGKTIVRRNSKKGEGEFKKTLKAILKMIPKSVKKVKF